MSPFARVARWLGGLLPERWTAQSAEDADTSSGSTAARPRPRGEWQRLTPLRTPGHRRPVEVSRVTGFARQLRADHRSPGSLAPLGHQVTRTAPQGVVTGIARAVTTTVQRVPASSGTGASSRSVDMPLRRQAAGSDRDGQPSRPAPGTPATAPGTPATAPGTPATAPAMPATAPAGPDDATSAGAPDRDATPSGVADAASEHVPAATDPGSGRASRPTVGAGPPPRVLRAAEGDSGTPPVTSTSAAMPRDLPLRRLGSPSRASETAATPAPRPSGDHASGDHEGRAASVAGDPPAEDQGDLGATTADERPTVGSSPIVVGPDASPGALRPDARATQPGDSPQEPTGLGEPLRALPPSARPVGSGPAPGGRSVTGRGRREAVSRGLQRWAATPTQGVAERETPSSGSVPTESSAADGPRPAGPPVVAASLPPVHRTVEDSPGPVVPTAGSTPLVERRDPPGPSGEPGDGAGPVEPAPVPVRWRDAAPAAGTGTPSRPGGRPGMTAARGERGGSPRRAIPAVMRAAAGRSVTTRPTTGHVAPAGPAAPVRSGGSTSGEPRGRTAVPGRRGSTGVPDGSSAKDVGSGEGSRLPLPQLPRILRWSVDATGESGAAAAGSGGGRVPQPAAAADPTSPTSPPAPPPVHRQAGEPADGASAPGASAPGAAAPDETAGDTEAGPAEGVDALFRKLYPRVRDELRWELRVQRERAGMLSDPL